jgi:hypothetical protein
MLDIHGVLTRLAADRPVFHSEADFQHSLAWRIHQENASAEIRLETRPERGVRLDLIVSLPDGRVAIELKYLVARLEVSVNGERFDLPNQAAQDHSRYDFIKDICRIERFVGDGYADSGWAIALSNDGSMWRSGGKRDPVDAAFRLHEGRVLERELAWSQQAGAGTTWKRETPLVLAGSYPCMWCDYSTLGKGVRNAAFRYLAVGVS